VGCCGLGRRGGMVAGWSGCRGAEGASTGAVRGCDDADLWRLRGLGQGGVANVGGAVK
jgi:hypothetical protein